MPTTRADASTTRPTTRSDADEFSEAARVVAPGRAITTGHQSIFLALAVLVAGVSAYVYHTGVFGLSGPVVRCCARADGGRERHR